MTPTTISILGCGWLGRPLGQHLLEAGYRVKGSTTTPSKLSTLEQDGITPYLIELAPDLTDDARDFFDADLLFLNVPPSRRRGDMPPYHRRQMTAVLEALEEAPIDFVVLVTSTGVYPNTNDVVTESDAGDPARATGRVLLEVERMFQQAEAFDTTILRLAGLYGPDRPPGRFLAGKEDVAGGEKPVNLVHRDDCIGVASAVIAQDVRGEVFNVCADEHPARRDLYVRAAKKLGRKPPTFDASAEKDFKIVSNEKLRKQLGYRFRHPNPLDDVR